MRRHTVTQRRGYPEKHISSGLERDHALFELGDGLAQGQVMISSGSICSRCL
jgi:hypothetical protein